MLMVWPSALRTMIETKIESGIEIEMTIVGRQSPEEKQDHACGQKSSSQGFHHHAPNRRAHEKRLIEERSDFHFRRKRLRRTLSHALHAFDDRDGRSAAHLQHRHQGATLAIHVHDVGLRREAVPNVGHVAHIDGRAIDGLDREFVQFRDGLRIAVHLDLVFQRTDLSRAGGENQILRAERIHDVVGRKAVGLQSRQVEVHLDLAYFATVGIGRRGARNGRQLRAQEVIAQIEELLLRQRLAAQAQAGRSESRRRNT